MNTVQKFILKISPWSFLLSFLIIFSAWPVEGRGNTFIDNLGRHVSIESEPDRIVSMAPNITEILYALGLGDKIVGVTNYCNYPPESSQKERIGGFINPSLEKIIYLKPDLIISTADGNRKETVMQIEKLGLPVYVVNPVNIEGLFNAIIGIGEITGRRDEGLKLVDKLRKRQERTITRVKSLPESRVFFQVGIEPIITISGRTFINELIAMSGGENIYSQAKSRYPRCSVEDVIARNPDIIIISSAGKIADFNRAKKFWERWTTLRAVQNNRIHWLDPDIVNRPSPRFIEALDQLTDILHPVQTQ